MVVSGKVHTRALQPEEIESLVIQTQHLIKGQQVQHARSEGPGGVSHHLLVHCHQLVWF